MCSKTDLNRDRFVLSEHENFPLAIMGGHKLSTLQQALTLEITETKQPVET